MSIVFNGKTIAGAPPQSDTANAAKKADLTSIIATGATNATGATITSGTFFYLNGTLVQALADIASGATFTENTNFEVPSAGSLNALKSALNIQTITEVGTVDINGNVSIASISPTNSVILSCVADRTYDSNTFGGYLSTNMAGTLFVFTPHGPTGNILTQNTNIRMILAYIPK